MKYYWIFGTMLLTLLFGCQSSSPDARKGPQLEIIHPAGSIPDINWNFLPYPTHYGMLGDYHVLLLSKAPKLGKTRSIQPIGMITTIEEGEELNWIIANDAHSDFKIKGLDNVNDLMTNHNGIKSTLERWIINRKGIGRVQLKGWKDVPSLTESNNQ